MYTQMLLLVLAATVYGEHFRYYGHDYDQTPLGDSIDKASMKLLKETFTDASDKNVVASPLGVLLLLSLYSSGAGPLGQEEITRLLGGTSRQAAFDSYGDLNQRFGSLDPSYLTLANKIYVAKDFSLKQSFSNAVRSYNSEAESIDFSDGSAAAAYINKWADEKTKGHIKNAVSADALTPDTAAALFNVIFFQGHWHVPFNKTEDKDFHIDEKTTVKKPNMHLLQSLFYYESEDLGAKMIELPYKENGFRMVVVLPNEINGLPSVLEKVAQKGVLTDVFKLEPAGRELDLTMPKFEITSDLDLKSLLPKVGVSNIFTEGAREVVNERSVIVSKAFQKAFVKVDEEGATAGAFTGFVAVPVSYPPQIPEPLKFTVDHPFLFLILHDDKILFCGTYTH